MFGIPPEILYAIHFNETKCAGDGPTLNTEGSRARGPMQFMPGTFAEYGFDGNGDGKTKIDEVVDSVFTAAKLLSSYPTLEKGLQAYGAIVFTTKKNARTPNLCK